jgi:hypothetical protein
MACAARTGHGITVLAMCHPVFIDARRAVIEDISFFLASLALIINSAFLPFFCVFLLD